LATVRFQGQKHQWNRKYTQYGWKQAHRNIWDSGLKIILANVLEVKITIKSSQPASQCDEEFGERRVYIHEKPALDIFAREAAKAVQR